MSAQGAGEGRGGDVILRQLIFRDFNSIEHNEPDLARLGNLTDSNLSLSYMFEIPVIRMATTPRSPGYVT